MQVVCDANGQLLWVSDPLAGSTHDTKAIREHGLLDLVDARQVIAGKGYIGLGVITPTKKPAGGTLSDNEKPTLQDQQNQICRGTLHRKLEDQAMPTAISVRSANVSGLRGMGEPPH